MEINSKSKINNILSIATKEEFESINKILLSLARTFSQKYPHTSFDDLYQEGYTHLMSIDSSYFDRSKGTKLTTWCYSVILNFFISYETKERKISFMYCYDDEIGSDIESSSLSYLRYETKDFFDFLKTVLSKQASKLLSRIIKEEKRIKSNNLSDDIIKDNSILQHEIMQIGKLFYNQIKSSDIDIVEMKKSCFGRFYSLKAKECQICSFRNECKSQSNISIQNTIQNILCDKKNKHILLFILNELLIKGPQSADQLKVSIEKAYSKSVIIHYYLHILKQEHLIAIQIDKRQRYYRLT